MLLESRFVVVGFVEGDAVFFLIGYQNIEALAARFFTPRGFAVS